MASGRISGKLAISVKIYYWFFHLEIMALTMVHWRPKAIKWPILTLSRLIYLIYFNNFMLILFRILNLWLQHVRHFSNVRILSLHHNAGQWYLDSAGLLESPLRVSSPNKTNYIWCWSTPFLQEINKQNVFMSLFHFWLFYVGGACL